MEILETYFDLPARPLSAGAVEALLRRTLEEWRWVTPARYGRLSTDHRLEAGEGVEALVAFHAREGQLAVKGRGGELIVSARAGGSGGYVSWFTSASAAAKPAWRARQGEQMVALAKLLEAPLAYATLQDVYAAKSRREVETEEGTRAVLRLRGYQEGLLGLFWRNVLGPPFTSLMQGRLRALEPAAARELGGGYWLVEPYPAPHDATSAAGQQREAELIAALGADLFYDFVNEEPPARRPALEPLPA